MKNRIGFFLLVLVLTNCSSIRYTSDQLGIIYHNQYTSFQLEDLCTESIDPLVRQKLKNALFKEFTIMELEYEKSSADLMVKFTVKNRKKHLYTDCIEEYDQWKSGQYCKERIIEYIEGTIIVDIIDTNEFDIIWHGSIQGPDWNTFKEMDRNLDPLIKNLLEDFFKE